MSTRVSVLLFILASAACATVQAPRVAPPRDSVAVLRPQCVGATSCVLGRVTAAENSQPLVRAAVFLQREGEQTVRIQTLTDDQGVFAVENPPPGRYRIAIYKDARKHEMSGLSLGATGTTVVPVALAPRS
jgi:hypothetical protein